MLFRTHLLLGIIFFLLARNLFSGGNELLFLVLVLLGSLLPDLDERGTIINQWFGIIGQVTPFFVRHRGLFHSLFLALLLYALLAWLWSSYYALGLLLGYLAHLVGDALTPGGVQIFYPFSRFKAKGPMKVGGWLEGVLFLIMVALILRWLWS